MIMEIVHLEDAHLNFFLAVNKLIEVRFVLGGFYGISTFVE